LIAASGAGALLAQGTMEHLAAYAHAGATPKAVAESWVRLAAREHSARRAGGAIILASTGALLGLSLALDLQSQRPGENNDRNAVLVAPIALSAAGTFLGAWLLTSDGPVESALHGYERSQGTRLWHLATDHVAVTPTRGGLSAGFVATF
jgi:hypothetical protein